jgi:predicted membrane-bound spermidine synthase
MTHFLRECWRVRWMIALVVVVVALRSFGVNRGLEGRRLSARLYAGLAVKRGVIIAAFVIAVASAF